MKNYNFNKNNKILLITSTSILTGTLLISTLSSCSIFSKESSVSSDNPIDTFDTFDTFETRISGEINSSGEISIPTDSTKLESYDFTWEYDETEAFEKVVNNKFNMSIASYISCYGFTNDFNRAYVDFINSRFHTNYKIDESGNYNEILKKSNYFFGYINRDYDVRHRYDDYEHFKKACLRTDKARLSGFSNKVILSYLIQNNIPLGSLVPIENFKSIMGDELYNYDSSLHIIISNPQTGNFESSYVYSKYELVELLQAYNSIIYKLCTDNSIKTCNLFEKPEVIILYNQHLKQFYGIDVKLGEELTEEQYKKMMGEDPLDLSYIQGAVVQKPQETFASPTTNMDYNYNVYYSPSYNMYIEDETGRSR